MNLVHHHPEVHRVAGFGINCLIGVTGNTQTYLTSHAAMKGQGVVTGVASFGRHYFAGHAWLAAGRDKGEDVVCYSRPTIPVGVQSHRRGLSKDYFRG